MYAAMCACALRKYANEQNRTAAQLDSKTNKKIYNKIETGANAPTNTTTATTDTARADTHTEKLEEQIVQNCYTHADTP